MSLVVTGLSAITSLLAIFFPQSRLLIYFNIVYPALASLSIVCDYLPWSVTVVPNPRAIWAAPYVTVGDILHSLFRTLRLGVTEIELDALELIGAGAG